MNDTPKSLDEMVDEWKLKMATFKQSLEKNGIPPVQDANWGKGDQVGTIGFTFDFITLIDDLIADRTHLTEANASLRNLLDGCKASRTEHHNEALSLKSKMAELREWASKEQETACEPDASAYLLQLIDKLYAMGLRTWITEVEAFLKENEATTQQQEKNV